VSLIPALQLDQILSAARPAVLYSDGIGDTLMSLPTLRALSRVLGGRTVFVGSPRSLEVLKAEGIAAKLVPRLDNPYGTAQLLERCDLLISADPGEQDSYARKLRSVLQPTWSVGWTSGCEIMLTSNDQLHFIDEVFQAATVFDRALAVDSFAGPPLLGMKEMDFANTLCREWEGNRCFVVHCETGAPKMWPIATFRRLLETLLSLVEDLIVLVVGVRSHGLDDMAYGDRVVSCEGLSLAKSMALVGCADGFVGIDSSMLHVADLFRVPAVALFGPTDPHRWGCRFAAHEHVRARGRRIDTLEVDEVMAAVNNLLRRVIPGKHERRVNFRPSS
jgi:hypothetical protein